MLLMQSDARLDQFVASLDEKEPPDGVSGALLGVWHALRGEWRPAHDAVQDDNAACAWVHAALHRDEGDHSNAAYWYREAGRPVATGSMRTEYLAIATTCITH